MKPTVEFTDVHVPQTASSPGGSSGRVAEVVQPSGDQNNPQPRGVEEGMTLHLPLLAGEQTASSSGDSSRRVAEVVQSGGDQSNPQPRGVGEGMTLHDSPPAGEQTASSSADSNGRVAEVVQPGGDQNNPEPRGVEEGVTFHVPPPAGEQTASGFGGSGESDAGDTEVVANAAQSDAERQPSGLLTRTGNDEQGAFGGNDEYDSFVAGGQNATDMAQSGLGRSSPTPRK